MYPFKILNKKKYILFELNALIVNLSIYLLPVVFSYFLSTNLTADKLLMLIVLVIILQLIGMIGNHIWTVPANIFFGRFQKDLQINYFKRIIDLPVSKLNEVHSGFLKKQVDVITTDAREFLRCIFDNINGIIISSTIFLITVYTQDKNIFMICLLMIIFIIIFNIFVSKKIKKTRESYNDENAKYNSLHSDLLQNIKTLKRLGSDNYATKKMENSYQDVDSKYRKLTIKTITRFNGVSLFVLILFVIILSNLYIKMKSGVEVLGYLTFYITIYTGLKSELSSLSQVFETMSSLKAANSQIEKILDENEIEEKVKKWNQIIIKDIKFKYDENSKQLIKIPYFELNKGEKISIIGKSGQGKTTFLNIFSRFLKVDEGNYIIDKKNVSGRLDLAYISQDIDLLNVSIYENIILDKKISKNKLVELLKDSELYDWIESLPDKLDTIVGERGVKLSAGQKQRLNIIRGILLDKEIYILDEPTSNLDKETEMQIINLINKHLKDKTVLIVTHRLELEKICDKHYYFENNTMKERL